MNVASSITIGQIHPTALISTRASLGQGVTVGAGAVVGENVVLGEHSIIGPQAILGEPLAGFYSGAAYSNPRLTVGERALIRSGSIIYAGSEIGSHFETGHRVTIREGTTIGDHVRVGTLSDLQGDCRLGDYVRLHSNVHIGMKSSIGDFVWIFPYTVLTNDPQPPSEVREGVVIDDFAVIATMVVILPGVRIGRDALVGAHSLVRSDVQAEAVVVGSPAKQVATIREVKARHGPNAGLPAYPWRDHFDRGMPWEGIGFEAWDHHRREESGV